MAIRDMLEGTGVDSSESMGGIFIEEQWGRFEGTGVDS